MTTTVLVRDVRTRRVHRRLREDGTRALYAPLVEELETSGAYVVLTDAEVERLEPDDFCRRCFTREGA